MLLVQRFLKKGKPVTKGAVTDTHPFSFLRKNGYVCAQKRTNNLLTKSEYMPNASLIISVYNNVPFLNAVLRSVNEQTWNDFEIIISEDGEHQEMRDFLNSFAFVHTWKHVHQEDLGWRKNKALNQAIQASNTDYLVFIDGDCVLHPRFMEMHLKMAKEGCVLGGKRLKLNKQLTREFLDGSRTHRNLGSFLTKNIFQIRNLHIRYPEESFFIAPEGFFGFLIRFRKIKELRGCNMSFYKKDLLNLNGFDEDYIKPAIGEDADPSWRLKKAGLKLRSVRNLAVVYHLHHDEVWSEQNENARLMQEKMEKGQFKCLNGILKLTDSSK